MIFDEPKRCCPNKLSCEWILKISSSKLAPAFDLNSCFLDHNLINYLKKDSVRKWTLFAFDVDCQHFFKTIIWNAVDFCIIDHFKLFLTDCFRSSFFQKKYCSVPCTNCTPTLSCTSIIPNEKILYWKTIFSFIFMNKTSTGIFEPPFTCWFAQTIGSWPISYHGQATESSSSPSKSAIKVFTKLIILSAKTVLFAKVSLKVFFGNEIRPTPAFMLKKNWTSCGPYHMILLIWPIWYDQYNPLT